MTIRIDIRIPRGVRAGADRRLVVMIGPFMRSIATPTDLTDFSFQVTR